MKIAFIGTHGVGKTTLCFDLAARLKRLDHGVDIVDYSGDAADPPAFKGFAGLIDTGGPKVVPTP